MCKEDRLLRIEKDFRKFVKNDFHHLNLKVDKIEDKVNSRTATYAFITAIITLITLIVK